MKWVDGRRQELSSGTWEQRILLPRASDPQGTMLTVGANRTALGNITMPPGTTNDPRSPILPLPQHQEPKVQFPEEAAGPPGSEWRFNIKQCDCLVYNNRQAHKYCCGGEHNFIVDVGPFDHN